MSKGQILIVEDDPTVAELTNLYLTKDGFSTKEIHTGEGVVDWVKAHTPELIVLDLMLPVVDGLTLCRQIRQFSMVPIIMTTARVDEIDRLLGLEIGADDYLCKPFELRELVARVNAILRRVAFYQQAASEAQLSYRDVQVDVERHSCTVADSPVELTKVEFRLLQVLISKPGRVYSRDQLMTHAYDENRVVSDRTIDTHVKNLRKKLALVVPDEELIHSIYGVGYKLE